MNEPEIRHLPDQWLCIQCGTSMGYILDRRYGTDLTDKEVYSLCVPCYVKRERERYIATIDLAVEHLRALGYDVSVSVDGRES